MAIVDFITELFCRVDDAMKDVPHHSQQALSPSELVTIGLLYAIKGVGCRYFYRWLSANYRDMFPSLPSRTRLLSPPSHTQSVDGALSCRTGCNGHHRHLRHRTSSSHPGGQKRQSDRQEGAFQPQMDSWRQALHRAGQCRTDRRLGLRDRQCPRQSPSSSD